MEAPEDGDGDGSKSKAYLHECLKTGLHLAVICGGAAAVVLVAALLVYYIKFMDFVYKTDAAPLFGVVVATLRGTYNINASVVIAACSRDNAKRLGMAISKVELTLRLFREGRVLIYENDSGDMTLTILRRWEARNPRVRVISERNVSSIMPLGHKRTHILSRARNLLLTEAVKLSPDFFIMMDLDERIDRLSSVDIISSFAHQGWAVMTANQYNKYYDIWALRTYDDWSPDDFWDCYNKTNNDRHFCLKRREAVHLPSSLPPLPVRSAFGGFAIYNTSYLRGAKYDGGSGDYQVCEHVALNQYILLNNSGKIFINPKMRNS